MRALKALIPTVLAITSGACLVGAEPHWGIQGGLALPIADLADTAGPGLQGGAHVRWNFGRGHGLMARADLTLYGQKDDRSSSSIGVGADYTYHLNQNAGGLYFLGGLAVVSTHWHLRDGRGRNDSNLGLALGAGYDLNRNLGVQARFTSHGGSDSTLDSLNLGVTYTF